MPDETASYRRSFDFIEFFGYFRSILSSPNSHILCIWQMYKLWKFLWFNCIFCDFSYISTCLKPYIFIKFAQIMCLITKPNYNMCFLRKYRQSRVIFTVLDILKFLILYKLMIYFWTTRLTTGIAPTNPLYITYNKNPAIKKIWKF